MNLLAKNTFLVKEHLGIFKAANNFDIFDPENGNKVLECREDKLGLFTKLFRFTDYKRMTPFNIEVRTPEGQKLITVKRGATFLISKVEVFDEQDKLIGKFKQKLFSIGGKFDVLTADDQLACKLKGNWIGWDFQFMKDEIELAQVSKKWGGIGKELFTSADNYVLSINNQVPEEGAIRKLILGAVLCIDMVLKE